MKATTGKTAAATMAGVLLGLGGVGFAIPEEVGTADGSVGREVDVKDGMEVTVASVVGKGFADIALEIDRGRQNVVVMVGVSIVVRRAASTTV